MTRFEIIFVFIYTLALSFSTILLYRSHLTFKLRNRINQLCYEYSLENIEKIVVKEKTSAYDWIYDGLPTYSQMVWSFKPLRLKYWIPEMDLAELLTMGKVTINGKNLRELNNGGV